MEPTFIKYSIEGEQCIRYACEKLRRDVDLWKELYISLIWPNIEFASSVWNPYLQEDISIPEKVQGIVKGIYKNNLFNYPTNVPILD